MDQLTSLLLSILFSQPTWTSNRQVRREKSPNKDHQTRQQVMVWWVTKHSPLFCVSGVELASPAAGWHPFTLDSHSRESPGLSGCWSLMAGSQDTPAAWTPQECVTKCGWGRVFQKVHLEYRHVPSQQQWQTVESHHSQENTLAMLRGFRQQTYCKRKRQRTWVLLTELVARALYNTLAMKVSQSNRNSKARYTSQGTKSQPLIVLQNN